MSVKKIISLSLAAAISASTLTIPVYTASAEPDEDYSAYVFAYFRRPPGQRDDERLCLGVSKDGYSFRALNGGEPVFASSTEHTPGLQYPGAFRDPQIMRGEDGKFYVAVTDLLGTGNKNHQITIYPTEDLINFEEGIVVDYSKYEGFEDTTRAWAPQIIWCPEHINEDGSEGAYMIYLAIARASKDEYGTCMYRQFTTDLYDVSKYTAPEYMIEGEPQNGALDYPDGAIDGDIIYDKFNDRYIMYYNGQNVAVSDEIDGIYSFTGEQVFGGRAVEGSNIFKLNGEDKWIMCADGGSFGTGFNMTSTTDFNTYTTLYPKSESNPDGYDYDFTPRHGYVVPITQSELEKLMLEYGYVDLPDRNDTENPLTELSLPYTAQGYRIAGNIRLPEEYKGFNLSWTSSDESIISTEKQEFTQEQIGEYGENYSGGIAAGVVTRPQEDTGVILTAKAEGTEYTKSFALRVKAAPEKDYKQMDADGDFKGYLYASFIEPAVTARYQQVYFASSDDGRNWTELNGNKPVLESGMGTGATRDHYILRSPEGDRFYLIATDLDVTGGKWGDYGERGSKCIMVWESDDLVNWSDQRMVQLADLTDETNTGCVWAPEATYDELTGEYIVYWSGKELREESPYYGKMVVWYSKTRDFYSFTPQKQFVYALDTDGEEGTNTSRSFIDSTMIQGSDGLFYRTTKYEEVSPLHVFVDAAKYPLGEFKRVKSNLDERDFLGTEGPGWFKYNKDDAENYGAKYCLMLDGYGNPNKGVGFFPNSIEDLNNGWESIEDGTANLEFTRIKENYHMRSYAKHGGIVPLTQAEYERVNEAYAGKAQYSDTKPFAVNAYDFENGALSEINASFTGGASIVEDAQKGKVLYLDGTANSYMEFAAPRDGSGKVLEDYTVSFDIKNETTGNYFNFYIGDGSSGKTGVNYFGAKIGDSVLLSSKNAATEMKQSFSAVGTQGKWRHCDIVVSDATAQIYMDNELLGSTNIFSMAESAASVIRFGFSAWSADNASRAYYDNIRVYPAALSAEGLMQEDMPDYFTDENKVFDANDYWVAVNDTSKLSGEAGWTSEQMPTFDGSGIHYIGIYPGKPVHMSEGYGKGTEWFAMQFKLTSWAHGDYAVRDTDGKVIFADCYAKDGYWVGHGERSFGGTVRDDYGVKRLESYLKSEITSESMLENTGKLEYGTDTLCTLLVENKHGKVDDYEGEYYTVKVYRDMKLAATSYYKGRINGIKTLENLGTNKDRNCFGDLKLYAPKDATVTPSTPKPSVSPSTPKPEGNIDTKRMLYGVDFNAQSTAAYKGKTVESGNFGYERVADGDYAAVFDGTSAYLKPKNEDGTNLLEGKDSIIVSMKAKPEKGATNGWLFYAAWNDNAQVSNRRSYVGLHDNGSEFIGERFWNSANNPTARSASRQNEWQQISYVITKDKAELYIDGEFKSEAQYPFSLSNILGTGTEQAVYIGKANWGSGEYFKGAIDNVEIYDFAPELSFENLDNLKTDLVLPTGDKEKDGYEIEWTSSDEETISKTGKVTRPETGSKEVTLTASIKFSAYVLTKTIKAMVRGMDYVDYELRVSDKKGVDIQPDMFGLFFEDINYGADGGLYAEMVENRSFEQKTTDAECGTGKFHANPSYAWSSDNGSLAFKSETPLNANNPTYLEFTGKSFKNQGYEGMYIEKGKQYKLSMWAKSASYTGEVGISVTKDGKTALSGTVIPSVTNEWTRYETELTAQESVRYGEFAVELGSNATVDFDMISLMPADAVKGVFRKDIAEKLKALNPGFLRFPGGCVIEGYNLEDRYQWKRSVGAVEERVQNWNRWAADTGYVNYNQTPGIGFYEYFELCEYLGCKALPVLSVGIPCEYQGGKNGYAVPMYKEDGSYTEEFYEYIQDAIDLVEFANGDVNTEWGKLRADMGHPEPFGLEMIGIGNEQWEKGGNGWYERYEAFEKELHKLYPQIKLISSSGPSASGGSFDSAWNWIRENQAKNENFTYAVDEHYYMSPEWFLANDTRYDNYDRGTKVFAGEYAAHTALTGEADKKNNLESAIAEAAFLTGVERNADVVYMASYAPLLARAGYVQWSPDLLWFNDKEIYATPNYHVQSMYMNNVGTYTLSNTVRNNNAAKVYQTTSFDERTGDIIVKLVNPYAYSERVRIELADEFKLTGEAEMTVLTGAEDEAYNSFEKPDSIAPKTSVIKAANTMNAELAPRSFTLLRIHTEQGAVSVINAEIKDDILSFDLAVNADIADKDVYAAVYDESGRMTAVFKNRTDCETAVKAGEEYTIKAMLWSKGTTVPTAATAIKKVKSESKYKLMSYTTTGSEYFGSWLNTQPKSIGTGLHLAVSEDGGNPTNPSDWVKKGYPLLSTAWNNAEPGPGHSSFTTDELGQPILVYHWGSRGSGRTTSMKNVHFSSDDEPVLNIARGEQVKEEYLQVKLEIVVE